MLKKIGTKFQTIIYNRFYFMSQNRLKFWNKKVLLSCLVALYIWEREKEGVGKRWRSY